MVDFARDGRLKVRSWNEARKRWSPVRTIQPNEMDRVALLPAIVLHGLPALPPAARPPRFKRIQRISIPDTIREN